MATEVSIRYVHVDSESGCRPMLGIRGAKKAYCVGTDLGKIYSASVPVQVFDKAANVLRHNDHYPIARYISYIEEKCNQPGTRISPKARKLLEFARDPDKFDEDILAEFSDAVPDGAEPAAEAKIAPAPGEAPAKRTKAPVITSTAAGSPAKRGRGRPPGSAGTGVIAQVAKELKVEPAHLRKACRASGLKAPYEDEKTIRTAWRKHGKK